MIVLALSEPDATAVSPCATHDANDLAGHVYDHMAEFAHDDVTSGFIVHRNSEDGSAAVTYRPGFVPAWTAVLRQALVPWAERLREAGFTVEIECCDDRGEKDVPQWLHVTGWSAAAPVDKQAAERKFGNLLTSIVGESFTGEGQEFPTSATDPRPCRCDSCKRRRCVATLTTDPQET